MARAYFWYQQITWMLFDQEQRFLMHVGSLLSLIFALKMMN